MVRIFNHWFSLSTVLRLVLEAVFLILSIALAVTLFSRGQYETTVQTVPSAILFALAMLVVNAGLGMYHANTKRSRLQVRARFVTSLLLALPVAYIIFGLMSPYRSEHELLELAAVLAFLAHACIRSYGSRSRRASMLLNRVMVVGTGAEAATIQASIKQPAPSFKIIGFYPVTSDEKVAVPMEKVFSSHASLAAVALENRVDQVVVALSERRGGALPLNELLKCKLAGVRVLDLSSYYEQVYGQVRLESLRASWLVFGDGFRQGSVRTVMKRIFDIVAALVLLVISAPAMLLAALCIATESGFPVFYKQERVGQGGKIFKVIKFRSMRVDAEGDGKARWATSNDDRVTRVGKVIRKFRIDELPQLFNVLKGEMSLVGPRPERPVFVEQLSEALPFYQARHSVKPGVTGWAQVRYHYGASVEDSAQKLQYDLYYVKNHTLFLDIVVLFETVGVVLTGQGAQ